MVGSDGRVYRFLLQFAIPYWTRTDERTSQTNFIIDKFLRQNNVTARNHLSVQPSAAIPVAQRLRMTLDVESRVALDDVFRWNDSADDIGQDLASLPTYFLQQVDEKLASSTTAETSQEEKEKLEKQIRCQVYNDIVQTKVDPKVFLRFVQTQLDGPENLFHFRRALAGQLASNSLLQYIFSVTERTPPRFVFLMSKALVMSPDFRVSYSNQGAYWNIVSLLLCLLVCRVLTSSFSIRSMTGFIEGHDIPFRMTPNIEALIGKTYLDGRFIRSIAMVAGAIREHREEFDPILRLLMRDDILAWYSKSLAKTDSKTQELERQLMERVSKNVSVLHARFSECAPTSTKASKEGSIDSRIRELYDAATNAENLSMMPTNYHAWL
jgi:transformation/transcription domain-associated protein